MWILCEIARSETYLGNDIMEMRKDEDQNKEHHKGSSSNPNGTHDVKDTLTTKNQVMQQFRSRSIV